jgi:VanZ family protein
MTIMVEAFKRFVPPVGVMAGIFFLSHQPGETLPLPALPGLDKLAHFAVYGLLAATLIRACSPAMRQVRPCRVVAIAILWCMLYGLTDEFHQYFIPGRSVSFQDIMADTLGALVVSVGWLFVHRTWAQTATAEDLSA